MSPRAQQPPATRISIAELPPGEGRDLPHNGYNPAECTKAREKGYNPIDVRWEKGQRRVDLVGQGLIIGSVVLRPDQMSAYEAEVRLYKETRPVDRPPTAITDSLKDKLADIVPGKLGNLLQGKPRPVENPPDLVKKLTQPAPGPESAIAEDIAKLLKGEK
jgi:hypothetical protein